MIMNLSVLGLLSQQVCNEIIIDQAENTKRTAALLQLELFLTARKLVPSTTVPVISLTYSQCLWQVLITDPQLYWSH